jgi:sugar phosphate isomerase/epimerase
MSNRREFLKRSGTFALGSCMLPFALLGFGSASHFAMPPAGVQLFTLFMTIDNDVAGTLKQIAGIGYKNIESAFSMKGGFYGMKQKEFTTVAKDIDLNWKRLHVLSPQDILDLDAEACILYLVCARIALGTADEVKSSTEVLAKTGEACKKAGINFAYHNHTHEFEKVGDVTPFEYMFSQTSADILKSELDLGWASVAGADPVELFKKYPGRFPLWHVKDIDKETKKPVEVGKGFVDFKRIFAAADSAGMKYYFVEQDGAPKPIENLTTSFNYLKSMLS